MTSPTATLPELEYAEEEALVNKQESNRRSVTQVDLTQKATESVVLRLNNEFGILNCLDGDTLLYIGPPPQTLSESQTWDHAYIQNHFSFPHRVHSSKFLGLDSKKFHELFGPRSVRTERRFRKEGILSRMSTKGIKVFVDLRPPTEDEEAIVLLTTLTCTKGILKWHTAQSKYGISPLLVGGQDDSSAIPVDLLLPATPPEDKIKSEKPKLHQSRKPFDSVNQSPDQGGSDSRENQYAENLVDVETQGKDTTSPNGNVSTSEQSAAPLVAPTATQPMPNSQKSSTDTLAATSSNLPETPAVDIPEYSPLRHRSAIERLVQAVEGGDPKLDSAPKVWTFFAVAKYFDCASHERISGWITRWLLSYPNSNFIQCNPEVALRIGLGTQSENATKDAFSILVGEKSLLNVVGESLPSILTPLVRSVHRRRLQLLDDDERNRIDHAAASLVRRIRQKFDDLVGEDMSWLQRSSHYKKIFSVVPRNPDEADVVDTLVREIKRFVRGRIYWVLCRTYDDDFSDFEQALKTVRTFYPDTRDTFRETYNNLNERERIFTRFFWIALNQEILADGKVNLWTERNGRLGLPQVDSTHLGQKMLDKTIPNGERMCQLVTKNDMCTKIAAFNQIERSRHRDAQTQIPEQPVLYTGAVTAVGHAGCTPCSHDTDGKEGYARLEGSANTTENQGSSSSARAYNSFKGFKNLYTRVTCPKHDQPAGPSAQNTEKRRKLSDTDVGSGAAPATSLAFDLLPIRLRTNLTKQHEECFDQADMNFEDPDRGRPINQNISLPQRDKGLNGDGARDTTVSLSPNLPDGCVPTTVEAKMHLEAEKFGHDNLRARNFQPSLPKLANNDSSMRDTTFRLPLANVNGKPSVSVDQTNQQAELVTSHDCAVEADEESKGRLVSAYDYVYDTADVQSRVVTAADWSLEADDMSWTRPEVKQQFSNYPYTQPLISQHGHLVYNELLHDITNVLHSICYEIAYPAHLFHGDNLLPTNLIDTLMCLDDDEWKYLPLWAGGNDDGTGGVFDEVDVPNLEAGGFRGGKRGMGSVGENGASSSVSESSFDDIGGDAISTVGRASKAATDGTQTVKSFSDFGSEDEGFMRQNELWDEIRNLRVDSGVLVGSEKENGAAKGKERAEEYNDGFDEQDADDVDTILGASSTDGADELMDDDDENLDATIADSNDDIDDDMEIIDSEDL